MVEMPASTVSSLARIHRKRLGLTQAQLTSLIGISRPQLANVTPDDVSASEP
jgi:transcriptional regulator with XRE-family HTH domain